MADDELEAAEAELAQAEKAHQELEQRHAEQRNRLAEESREDRDRYFAASQKVEQIKRDRAGDVGTIVIGGGAQ